MQTDLMSKDHAARCLRANIACIVVLALLLAVECVMALAVVLAMVPPVVPAFVRDMFPGGLSQVKPEHDMLLYHTWVFLTFGLSLAGAFIARRRMTRELLWPLLGKTTVVTACAVGFLLVIAFKGVTVPALTWPSWALPLGLAAAFLLQAFHGEAGAAFAWWQERIWPRVKPLPWGGVFLGLLVFCLWLPDRQAVCARIYNVDQFYHFDGTVMASGWAWIKGCVLNQDVISQYGVLLPMTIARLAQALGGFDYDHVVLALLVLTLVYCGGLYMFLARWLNARWLAVCGTLFFVKWDLFHREAYPFVWMIPNIIPIRYIFDVPVLLLLTMHARTDRPWALWGAAGLSGLAFAYTIDTGVYLIFALTAYVFFRHMQRREWASLPFSLAGVAGIAAAVAACALGAATRGASFHPDFWLRFSEHARLFLAGWGALPVYDGLKDGYFFAFWMGMFIPVFYVATLLACAAAMLRRKAPPEWIVAATLALYGLALFHYYICRSASSNYYVVCMPFAALLCFWLGEAVRRMRPGAARWVPLGAVLWSMAALATNTLFAFYPNALHMAKDDYGPEKKYYAETFHFEDDAAFIRRSTRADEPVALISSFDVELLRLADRKPFFYYFPLMASRPFEWPVIAGTYLHTRERMARTLGQLEDERPGRIFIEKRMFDRTVNPAYFSQLQSVGELMNYVDAHYSRAAEGRHLVALVRKPQ